MPSRLTAHWQRMHIIAKVAVGRVILLKFYSKLINSSRKSCFTKKIDLLTFIEKNNKFLAFNVKQRIMNL